MDYSYCSSSSSSSILTREDSSPSSSIISTSDSGSPERNSSFPSSSIISTNDSGTPKSHSSESSSPIQSGCVFEGSPETETKPQTCSLAVSIEDLASYSSVVSPSAVDTIWAAVKFYAINYQWEFFYCYFCDKKFLDVESHVDHVLVEHHRLHIPKSCDESGVLLPVSASAQKKRDFVSPFDINSRDPCLAWFRFLYDNGADSFLRNRVRGENGKNNFAAHGMTAGNDERIGLLEQIGESLDSLMSHHDEYLSTGHLNRLIERTTDCFIGGLPYEKLVVARDILDRCVHIPFGLLDEKCLRLVLNRLKSLQRLFLRVGNSTLMTQELHHHELEQNDGNRKSHDDFLHSISLHDKCSEIRCDPTKLPPPVSEELEVPWDNAKKREIFSDIVKRIEYQLDLLNEKAKKKDELLRNWDFVFLLERMVLFRNESSASAILSSLSQWRDKLSKISSSDGFRLNFLSEVLRTAQHSHKSIQVVFGEIKYHRVLDKLDVVDAQMSAILAGVNKLKERLSLVSAFDYRMTLVPILRAVAAARDDNNINIGKKSELTLGREKQRCRLRSSLGVWDLPRTSTMAKPLVNSEDFPKLRDFWRSLSDEKKKEILSVSPGSIYDYCNNHLESPWLANDVADAEQFFNLNNTWRFLPCLGCSRRFCDEGAFLKHIAQVDFPFDLTNWGWSSSSSSSRDDSIGKSCLAHVLLKMSWTPVDISSAFLEDFFIEMRIAGELPEDYAYMEWPTTSSPTGEDEKRERANPAPTVENEKRERANREDFFIEMPDNCAYMEWPTTPTPTGEDEKRERANRLKLLKEHLHALLQQEPSMLRYTHLQTLIHLAAEQVAIRQLTSPKDRLLFRRLLRRSPVCFRFLDSESLGRIVGHLSALCIVAGCKQPMSRRLDTPSESTLWGEYHWFHSGNKAMFENKSVRFWEARENISSVSYAHGGDYRLDETFFSTLLADDDHQLSPLVMMVPKEISRFPEKLFIAQECAQQLFYKICQNIGWNSSFELIHHYVGHLEEHVCLWKWNKSFCSSRDQYDSLVMKRYRELLGKARPNFYLGTDFNKYYQKFAFRCHCLEHNRAMTCCYCCSVASVELKKEFYVCSEEREQYFSSWEFVYMLMGLEPKFRNFRLDYRVIILPLMMFLVMKKLVVWSNGGGQEEFYKACGNNEQTGRTIQ